MGFRLINFFLDFCTSNASLSPTDCIINFTTTGRSSTSAEGSICTTDTRTCNLNVKKYLKSIKFCVYETKYYWHTFSKPIFFLSRVIFPLSSEFYKSTLTVISVMLLIVHVSSITNRAMWLSLFAVQSYWTVVLVLWCPFTWKLSSLPQINLLIDVWLTSAKRSGRKLRLDRASRIETVSPVFWQRSSLCDKSNIDILK